ncbi:MAG: type II toxin-antitoxin system RelE/ParE family toxin [Tepidisphaeraceae bacterium]
MAKTDVVFYAEFDRTCPAILWLDQIPNNPKDKLFYRVRRLEQAGHELRRPEADFLRDGIYELRVRSQRVNYRLLYFFHQGKAVIAHGCTKEREVDDSDIERAIAQRSRYETNPKGYRYIPSANG